MALNGYYQAQAEKQATQIFDSLSPTQQQTMSLAAITEHVSICIEASNEYKCTMNPRSIKFGLSRDEIFEIAIEQARRLNRSRGYRTLVSKYGEQAAKNIINRNTR